jgi:hypothetical protein
MSFSTLRKCAAGVALLIALLLVCSLFAEVLFTAGHLDVREVKAHIACQSLYAMAQAYRDHSANTKHEYPRTLSDLHQPPWGGPSFLKLGPDDLQDPWGKPYQMELRKTADGRDYVLIWTTTPDGMRVSNFGIGPIATPDL